MGFFTPSSTTGDRNEKVDLGITTLLAMSILLLMISDKIPTTSNFVPLIGWFYLFVIVLIAIGTILTSVIIGVERQKLHGKRVPILVRRFFFNVVARWVCVTPSTAFMQRKKFVRRCKQEVVASNRDISTMDEFCLLDNAKISAIESNGDVSPTRNYQESSTERNILKNAADILPKIETIKELIGKSEDLDFVWLEWAYLATILDRVFLIIFSSIAIALTSGIIICCMVF